MPPSDHAQFSSDWLALRERYDHAARSPAVLGEVLGYLSRRMRPVIIDLGAGRGSTVRAIDPDNALEARWILLDHDPQVLRDAETLLGASHSIETLCVPLSEIDEVLAHETPDLVTASALLDLVSKAWLSNVIGLCATKGSALYFAMSIDGRANFDPPHLADRVLVSALAEHARRDKGLGPALGPEAAAIQAQIAHAKGFTVHDARADWHVPTQNSALDIAMASAFLDGWRSAAHETGHGTIADSWHAHHLEHAVCGELTVSVGHRDMFAEVTQEARKS